jgi:glyoxalase superfamily protein
MPVRLHHIVVDAHDLPGLARFWTQARRVDIGQTGAESWTVLADPEGNEFCVVRPKETLIS